MKLHIDPQAHLPIYAQIIEQIQSVIVSGRWPPGAALPSVRTLAADLEINSLTIQKAYKHLETEGWIAIRKGVGAVVADVSRQSAAKGGERLSRDVKQLVGKAKALGVPRRAVLDDINSAWEQDE